ncbi:hypothetical protein KL912_005363 [Ogataea haglerorum]|nr:hypothetical protein KL912_005363 [Ogataea haglerorum]KAG7783260.1 hypothetical protein KL945_005384 [Ogataea haglerorum]KAG7783922.1 hypothetical protein KL910_005358 [Ogataea haglerorum]
MIKWFRPSIDLVQDFHILRGPRKVGCLYHTLKVNQKDSKPEQKQSKSLVNDLMDLLEKPIHRRDIDQHVENKLTMVKSIESFEKDHYQRILRELTSVLQPLKISSNQHQPISACHSLLLSEVKAVNQYIRKLRKQSDLVFVADYLLAHGRLNTTFLASLVFKMNRATLKSFISTTINDCRFTSLDKSLLCKAYVIFCYRSRQLQMMTLSDHLIKQHLSSLWLPCIRSEQFTNAKYLRNLMSILMEALDENDLLSIVKSTKSMHMAYVLWELKPNRYRDIKEAFIGSSHHPSSNRNLSPHQKLILYLLSNPGVYQDHQLQIKLNELSRRHRLSYGECLSENSFLESLKSIIASQNTVFFG